MSTRAFDVFVSLSSSSSTRRPLQKRSMKSQYLASKKLFLPRLLLVELLVWTFRCPGNILSRSDLVSDGLTILSEVLSSNPSGASTCDVLNPNLFPNGTKHKQKLVRPWAQAMFQAVFSGLYSRCAVLLSLLGCIKCKETVRGIYPGWKRCRFHRRNFFLNGVKCNG